VIGTGMLSTWERGIEIALLVLHYRSPLLGADRAVTRYAAEAGPMRGKVTRMESLLGHGGEHWEGVRLRSLPIVMFLHEYETNTV
jgi:hypothetical protein